MKGVQGISPTKCCAATLLVPSHRLGLNEGDLEKLEGELDLLLAKTEIAELRKEALDKINTYKRRYSPAQCGSCVGARLYGHLCGCLSVTCP